MTLVEMMVALAIFAVAMGVVFTFIVNSRRSYENISDRVEYQQTIRGALSLISREIRSAGCDPRETGFTRFPVADAGQLRCRMDLDADGIIEIVEPAEDVIYTFLDATDELTRDSGSGPQTILRNVNNLVFQYFDADGNLLGPVPLTANNRALIRFVEIDISGESDRGEPVNYATRVLIRNN
jgi:prepilin-type N-terminal cleavage/methylation domain-containing protein